MSETVERDPRTEDSLDLLSDARGVIEALLEECRGGATYKLEDRIETAERWLDASRELRNRGPE